MSIPPPIPHNVVSKVCDVMSCIYFNFAHSNNSGASEPFEVRVARVIRMTWAVVELSTVLCLEWNERMWWEAA